jgi:hypothetical protein
MPLRGRVGRHHKTGGRHCQNWVEDQRTIVDLLNQIPIEQGGAGRKLQPRIVAGIASDDLSAAILRFEDKHFPGQRSGFVDPGGRMYQRMESLTAAAPPPSDPPPPTAIDELLAKTEKLKGNPNYFAVVSFLERLKREGYDKPIQNRLILAYCWGHFRFVKGQGTALPAMIHTATPYYRGDVLKPSKNSHVVMMTNSTLATITNNKIEYLRATQVTIGKVVLEEPEVTVTLGPIEMEEPGVTIGPVIIEK